MLGMLWCPSRDASRAVTPLETLPCLQHRARHFSAFARHRAITQEQNPSVPVFSTRQVRLVLDRDSTAARVGNRSRARPDLIIAAASWPRPIESMLEHEQSSEARLWAFDCDRVSASLKRRVRVHRKTRTVLPARNELTRGQRGKRRYAAIDLSRRVGRILNSDRTEVHAVRRGHRRGTSDEGCEGKNR